MRVALQLKLKRSLDLRPEECYRIMGQDGHIITPEEYPPEIDEPTLLAWYRLMCTTNHMDHLLYNAQRQVRVCRAGSPYWQSERVWRVACRDASPST
jgi:hypothetical protein